MNRFTKQFLLGVRSHKLAYQHIREHGLWHYFVWPILLAIGILWGGATLITGLTEWTVETLKALLWDQDTPDGFLDKVVFYLVWIVFKVLFFYTYYIVNKYIVFIILSPVLAIISERVDTHQTGRQFPFSLPQLYKDVLRGIVIALRNLFLEYAATLVLLVVSIFLPVFAPFYPIVIFFIAAYFYGFSFLDYNSERYRYSYSKSVRIIRSNMGLSVGIGTVFSLLFFIPILGGIVAPILSCVAATIAFIKEFKPKSDSTLVTT
ncbi:EI24 domain-containing protein [Luteibaculum oceani]|uniref:EI24 domain-containing protein n=1 Tax=Luteibaculum oceani TaxID=1294296 RepID=A0A5C6VA37_9FLAO|nr:EI24 domain-containing protein [Luteibaculum oceani]TXC81700.1 hypothetical protein FRX97_04065 [Luteibaculum oceani]